MSYPFQFFEGFAIVSKAIGPSVPGRVQFRGSWWKAICRGAVTLPPGAVVRVVGREDITLVVEPESRLSSSDLSGIVVHQSSEEACDT
ncbi:hypothetical protein CKA32_003882 [Geitlerinema sp. FC II]|uniref:NfeD family protein n=1 Tax=Baaleninema simplex TaxID=2862350 RepID=UPI00034B4273|nr:NfeD family protein [Baaleninema simplex]MDC0834908.1 NfeD family protein [Geitlerinema sp. CS-897]PPT09319.1 hypothetical protein CKA32_003882 [Geitlerinema sp. FC II]